VDTPARILYLDSLFQNMQEGVALCALVYDEGGKPVDYRIVDVNPAYCRHTGIPGEQAIGSLAGALYGADPPPHLDIFAEVALTGEPVDFESSLEPLGKHFRISVSSPRHGWFATVFEDITDRVLIQGRLLRAQHMEEMATVVGGIAHEFSNILNNVLGFNTLTRKYAHDREKSLKYSRAIEKSVQRGDEITQRLLAFARVEHRALEPVDVAGLVEEVANTIQRELPASVLLLKRIDPGLPPVLGVRSELVQAFMNLCLNGRDAILQKPTTEEQGTITIDAERALVAEDLASTLMLRAGSPCLLLRFTDTGIGIREEIADHIFDPFFTTKEPGRGTGLGLSIVYTIIRGHHGTITVDSSVGRGSTFRIYLPTLDPTREQTPPDGSAKAPTCAELILLVDDEQPMLEFGRDILADHGYRVITATNGAEAIERYREHANDVAMVILDLIMPRMDGGQTYIELKKINASVKAMFCTGYTSDEVISSLLQEEHLRAVRKPFQIEEFVGTVRAVLDDGQ
jgi:two-component system, cell cycle sensor histidine kinase and response regulator CckA